ncbi:hypothetical protein AB9E13_33360, partial [Rhizobium leguminosarum]
QEHAVRLQQVRDAFFDLPEEQREALHLVAIEDLSYHEAAQALGMFLDGRQRLLGFESRFIVAERQRSVPAKTIDMGIVQDGEQPGAQVASAAEALSLL